MIKVASVTQVRLVDDLDGGPADETVALGLDGKELAIDLSESNAAKLRDAIAPYVAAARRVGATQRRQTASTGPRRDISEIRQVLRDLGYEVKDRGRISVDLMQAYEGRIPAPTQLAASGGGGLDEFASERDSIPQPEFSGTGG